MPDPMKRNPLGGAPLGGSPLGNAPPLPEPSATPPETDSPLVEPEAPALPESSLPSASAEKKSPAELAELANQLYDSATKMQRDAEALMNAIKDNDTGLPEEGAALDENMTPEESDAASKALIGL